MGSGIILLVRLATKINFIPQKRFRTKWMSRNPVKVLSENAAEVQDGIEDKLSIETQILKAGNLAERHEESPSVIKQTDTKHSKLSAVVAERLQKQNEHETILNKRELRQLTKKEQNVCRTDPFGLSVMIPGDENDSEKLSDTGLPHFPERHPDGNSFAYYSSNSTIYRNSVSDSVQVSDISEKPTRCKSEHIHATTTARKPFPQKGDEKLRKNMLLTKSKKMREKHNLVTVEGKRLIKDFIEAGATPKMIFFSRQQDIEGICTLQNNVEFHRVPYKQLSLWTDVATTQGVIGLFEISNILRQTPVENSMPITVICDNVRDPGNMGSVLRIAAAAGCEKVIVTKGCVDLWDSKVLRSAAGAHSRLPLIADLSWDDVPEHLPDGCVTFAADSSQLQSHVTPLLHYNKADFGSALHIALIVGGETHGLSSSALALASARLHVPLSLGVDSLNTAVAFAVIVFEARRHLTAGT